MNFLRGIFVLVVFATYSTVLHDYILPFIEKRWQKRKHKNSEE